MTATTATIGTVPSRRPRLLRAVLVALATAAGVAASALVFGAVLPSSPGGATTPPHPRPLSARDAAAARAVVDRARQLLTVTPAQLGYALRIAGPVAGLRGQTDSATRTITLFVSPTDTPNLVAHDLAHEIGHAFDARRLSPPQRAAYLRSRGVPRAPWSPGARASDYRSGAGDFAEVFALCHAASPVFRSRLAARPVVPCDALPKEARAAKLGEGGT